MAPNIDPLTALIIPARNEEETVYDTVKQSLPQVDLVVVVDDGSEDSTARRARLAGAEVISHAVPKGLGASISTGFTAVHSRGFTTVATLDADGAHDPRYLTRALYIHSSANAALTIGTRLRHRDDHPVFPSTKLDANIFASLLLHHTTGTPAIDVASGFRVLSSKMAQFFPTEDDYGVSYELICRCSAADLKVVTVPIRARYNAFELFGTRRSELQALVRISRKYSKPDFHCDGLDALAKAAEQLDSFVVRIGHDEFVFHPLAKHAVFLIQRQNSFFKDRTKPHYAVINIGDNNNG